MQTIAQRKARLNGWIKTYEDRIEMYKTKYGPKSMKGSGYIRYCKFKIEGWRKQYAKLDKMRSTLDKASVVKFILAKTEEYFGEPVVYSKSRHDNADNSPGKYYLSKFIVDKGLCSADSCAAINTRERAVYARRDSLTSNKEHKNSYRAFRIYMDEVLSNSKFKHE